MQSSICSYIRLGYRICVKAALWLYLIPAGRPVTDVTNVTLLAEKSRTKQKINLNMGKSHTPSCVLEREHHSPPWAAWETACFIMIFTTGCKEIFTFPVPVWVPTNGRQSLLNFSDVGPSHRLLQHGLPVRSHSPSGTHLLQCGVLHRLQVDAPLWTHSHITVLSTQVLAGVPACPVHQHKNSSMAPASPGTSLWLLSKCS